MTYFSEGSEAMLQLEAMIDKVGTANVLYALEHICRAKSQHLEEVWQDAQSAQWWSQRANAFGAAASMPFMHDA